MRSLCRFPLVVVAAMSIVTTARAVVIDFEDVPLADNSYYNGSDGAGSFTSGGATFTNTYRSDYRSWMGWAASNMTDTQTPGYTNQYSAFPGAGGDGSRNFGVAFLGTNTYTPGVEGEEHSGLVILPDGTEPVSVQIANTTYAALSMKNGDGFAKRFGGPSGGDPDWFRLTITGNNADGVAVAGAYVFLADYRAPSATGDSIASEWINVNLSSFRGRGVASLAFQLNSTDSGEFGMNTPAYIAMDNLVLAATSPTFAPGDANRDGRVDASDLAATVANLGQTSGASWATGDFNDDGRVSLADVMLLRANLPAAGGGNPTTVPEPTTFALAVAGAGLIWLVRRRR